MNQNINININLNNTKFSTLYQQITALPPITTAVIYPDSEEALAGAVFAAQAGFIHPIFLCDKNEVMQLAAKLSLDMSPYPIFDLIPRDAIVQGVKMARQGEAHAIMKGSVHTDELMAEIVNSERGLRIGKRMSHCMVVDVPKYSKLLMLTDVALNIAPSLQEKKDIVQNAIDLACALGNTLPKVALLAAVEAVNEKMPSTIESATLCKMAERGQIKGGILEGPLSFDLAIAKTAVAIKKLPLTVVGDADILVVPNLECGNILIKALDYFAGAFSLGLIVGVKVPIIVTSRAATAESRVGSCMLAKFYHYSRS